MRKIGTALLFSLLVTGISLYRALPASGETVVWQDAMGRDVSLNLPVSRIVSLAPSVTETLYAIGAGDLIVGVSKHCDYPVAAKLKPKAGDFNGPDLAAVKAAAADAVLFAEYARSEDLRSLKDAGIPALVLPAGSVDDIMSTVRRLGELTGRRENAGSVVSGIEKALESVRASMGDVPDDRRPGVYIEVDGPKILYAVGPGSFMDDVVRMAGGRNVFAHKTSAYFPVSSQEVIEADPQVILVDYPFQYKVGVTKRPGWEAISAVREGRVYDGTDYDIILFNRPGPRIVQSLGEISRLLHPDRLDEN